MVMKNCLKWLILIIVVFSVCHGLIRETEDAIIVEADDQPDSVGIRLRNENPEKHERNKRNILANYPQFQSYPDTPNWRDALGEGKACLTSKGHLGQCTTFRECYPYFKIPDLTIWESWVLGNYDSCTYFNEEGRQAFGVCCTNPITPTPPTSSSDEDVTENPTDINAQTVSNKAPYPPGGLYNPFWSGHQNHPDFITHPPNHTAATHPPHITAGYPMGPTTPRPTVTTTTIRSTTGWPTKPPSYYPGGHPPTTTTTTTKKPTYNLPMAGVCGLKNKYVKDQHRIVGGTTAGQHEWPMIAVLFNGGRQFCGGSLIDNNHILTAAHCVAHMSSWDVSRLTVRLADHNIRLDTETVHIQRKVKRVVRHLKFDMRTLFNDIAILTMDTPVEYSVTARPVCLPSRGRAYSGYMATVVGWGSIRENGPQPALLQRVDIPIWSNEQCKQKYGNAAPGGIDDGMLCAGQDLKDSCSGDSGGPLMVNEGNIWFQVGVVSWGIGCGKGQYPGVYARVTHYLDWIYRNLVY